MHHHYRNFHNSFFIPKRFAFNKGAEAATFAEGEMENFPGNFEAHLKSGEVIDPAKIMAEAKNALDDVEKRNLKALFEALQKDPDREEWREEYGKLEGRIKAARKKAEAAIQEGIEKYKAIVAFVRKKSEAELALTESENTWKEEYDYDYQYLRALQEDLKKMNQLRGEFVAMEPPEMQAEKIEILDKIDMRITQLETIEEKSETHIEGKINEHDNILEHLSEIDYDNELDAPDYLILRAHLTYLKGVESELKGTPLATTASLKIGEIERVLEEGRKELEKHEDYKAALTKLDKWEQNLIAARKNAARVQASPGSFSKEEREHARGWIAGAEQKYEQVQKELEEQFNAPDDEEKESEPAEPLDDDFESPDDDTDDPLHNV